MLFAIIFIVFVFIVFFLIDSKVPKARNNIILVSPHTISVKKREKRNATLLSISRYFHTAYDYHPASVTYTGATVGGITTGGVTYNKAHYTAKAGAITDKYILFFKKGKKVSDQKEVIYKIILTPDDVEIAKKDPNLSIYLQEDTLHLVPDPNRRKTNPSASILWTEEERSKIEKAGDTGGAETLLTKGEIQPIYNFICNLGDYSIGR